MGPNTSFLLLICGVLAIYCEFIWPGRILPSVIGLVSAVVGGYYLWLNSPRPASVLLIVTAALLFTAEVLWHAHFVAGIAAVACLVAGFCTLFDPPRAIARLLAVPVSILFGVVTIILASGARRARDNKRSDVTDSQNEGTSSGFKT